MRGMIIGFAAGVCWLQTQATLPSAPWLLVALTLAAVSMVVAWHLPLPAWGICCRTLSGVLIGLCWAALVAQHYLKQELPAALEGQDLVLVGVIESLPERT